MSGQKDEHIPNYVREAGPRFYVAFGSNLESEHTSSLEVLIEAMRLIADKGHKLISVSEYYQTPAFPAGLGPDYVNFVAEYETLSTPEEILAQLHNIEDQLGRVRHLRWGDRVVDLDLLSFDARILPSEDVVHEWLKLPADQQSKKTPNSIILPHPRLQDRAFVLIPMADIAPNWCHPILGKTVTEMLAEIPEGDKLAVKVIKG